MKSGETFAGIRVRQADESFVLRDTTGAERRLDSSQIKTVDQLKTSLMPEGLLIALSREEIRDLFAYLQHLK
jgi:putative heme-binding domain-containing protein